MNAPDHEIFARAADRVSAWSRPLLISHAKPDGDALGSLAAMRAMLRSKDINATALLFDEIPGRYDLFHRFDPMPVLGRDISQGDLDNFDGVIALDTCAYGQLTPVADWLRAAKTPKVVVDHHTTRDVLADEYVIDESAAATCLVLHDWARELGWPLPVEACEPLFVGLSMDTGWFRHSNTDQRVFRVAMDLVERGIKPHELHQQLFMGETPRRVRLLGAALGTLELLFDDQLAVMALSSDAMAACGATPADSEDIINEPLRIGSVRVSVLLIEQGDGQIRASFRSKPPDPQPRPSPLAKGGPREVPTAEPQPKSSPLAKGGPREVPTAEPQPKSSPLTKGGLRGVSTAEPQPKSSPLTKGGLRGGSSSYPQPPIAINVADVALSFGGGGHARASGARITGTLHEVRQKIIDHLQRELKK